MDFSLMNGYEFEEFVKQILIEMGFNAKVTSLSGDGGIDIEAYNSNPIFEGKYLIQCKNWKNQVGQPEVRDLYGVITSERANKGILITTSYFTKQAIDFAHNKNIELIDGLKLLEIINRYNINIEPYINNSTSNNNFLEDSSFNVNKYNFLLNRATTTNELNSYLDLTNFIIDYITLDNYTLLKNGLLLEFIKTNNYIINKLTKNKNQYHIKKMCTFNNTYSYLLLGNITDCINCMLDLNIFSPAIYDSYFPFKFSFKWTPNFSSIPNLIKIHNECQLNGANGFNVTYKEFYNNTQNVLLLNLYNISKQIHATQMTDSIKSLIFDKSKLTESHFLNLEDDFAKSISIDDIDGFFPYTLSNNSCFIEYSNKVDVDEFINIYYGDRANDIRDELNQVSIAI